MRFVEVFFFFQAEDGIRDLTVTGVQTCALPISASPTREYYEAGIRAWEMLQTDSALKRWRTAINIDPQFALAHLFLSYATPDPMEAQRERQQAKSLAAHATSGEQLLIAWFDGVRENEYLSGIAAMNDLLQQYPKTSTSLSGQAVGFSIRKNTNWRKNGLNKQQHSILISPHR